MPEKLKPMDNVAMHLLNMDKTFNLYDDLMTYNAYKQISYMKTD